MEKQMEFPLQTTSFPTKTPHMRAYSRNASSLASLSSEYARHKPSGNALKTAGSLLVAVGLALRLNTSSADNQQEELDQHSQFAKSVEELETEERRLHGNVIIRWLYVVGDALHYYIIEPLGTTKRFIVLVLLFAPVILTMPMLLVGRRREGGRRRGRRVPKTEGGQRWGALWWYAFLVKQMERAGPTFIKLAQWAGSRQDLFPKELCDLLGKLHSNGKPHSLAYTKKVIENVFGRPFDEVFEHFPDEPLGIGAVAQVSEL